MVAQRLTIAPHPALALAAFVTIYPRPLEECPSPAWLTQLLRLDSDVPFRSDDAVRAAVRDLLRHGGYKPTGRGKPASEYLLRAAGAGELPSINAAVDACNVASLHTGLPISVIDLDGATPPLRVGVADEGASYVFNAAGQSIDLGGLVCLFDAAGPTANAVKDAQRTKTHGGTLRTLSVVWGPRSLGGRTQECARFYRDLCERLGATTEPVEAHEGDVRDGACE